VAWEPLGWEALAFCEIEDFPSAVLAYHYPDVPNLGDITKVDWKKVIEKYGRPDVVVGGSPCQSFSVAGGRESLDGESRLMFEYIRALDEIRPTWFLWENVPGVLNTKDNAFSQLLWEVQDLGYDSVAWRVLDAQFFGVAQRRRRVFLVGRIGAGGGSAAVLFESESVCGDTQTSREKREELTRAAGRSAHGSCGESLNAWDVQSKRIFSEDGTAPTLPSGSCEGMTIQPSVLQSAGFKYHQGAQAGNIGYESEQSPTLTADYHQPGVIAFAQNTRNEVRLQGGDGQRAGAVEAQPGKNQTYVMTNYGEEIAGTLTRRADSSPSPMGGQNVVCMASGHANAEVCQDMSPTVLSHAAKQAPIVCMADDNAHAAVDENMSGTLKRGGGTPMVAYFSQTEAT
jgi:DNA (cytosine-5)-methyltransferase 1